MVLVTDAALVELGVAGRLVAALEAAGARCALFAEIAGEPKQAQVEAATEFVRSRGAGLVVCLGGGSAMDVGKVAATIALTEDGPAAFAMEGKPLPQARRAEALPADHRRHRLGVLLDQHLHQPRRPQGLGLGQRDQARAGDPRPRAVRHACRPSSPPGPASTPSSTRSRPRTNVYRHAWNDLYAHRALGLIAGALETAVREPANLAARGDMLLGAAYAGIAIDNCSAGLAHNLSHALAALGPVHHGLATALGLEIVLGWQAATDQGAVRRGGRGLRSRPGCRGAGRLVLRLPHPLRRRAPAAGPVRGPGRRGARRRDAGARDPVHAPLQRARGRRMPTSTASPPR